MRANDRNDLESEARADRRIFRGELVRCVEVLSFPGG
jgi:hypothetical protein